LIEIHLRVKLSKKIIMSTLKYKNRIHKRRLSNVLSLQELARIDFPAYLQENEYDKLSEKQQNNKFKRFFACWIGKTYNGWRQLEKARRAISDNFIIELEDRYNLDNGILDIEDNNTVREHIFFLICSQLADRFIARNNIDITSPQRSALIDGIFHLSQNQPQRLESCLRTQSRVLGIYYGTESDPE